MIDELDFDGLSAGMLSPVDAEGKWMCLFYFRDKLEIKRSLQNTISARMC
jgi:hypothetical protein